MTLKRRVRMLEAKSTGPAPTGKMHIAIVRPGSTIEAERAKMVDLQEGDDVCFVRLVRPGDPIAIPTKH